MHAVRSYFPYFNVTLTFQGDGNSTGPNGANIGTTLPCGYCWQEQPPWSVYRESSFGHGTLDIINATTALWRVTHALHCLIFARRTTLLSTVALEEQALCVVRVRPLVACQLSPPVHLWPGTHAPASAV